MNKEKNFQEKADEVHKMVEYIMSRFGSFERFLEAVEGYGLYIPADVLSSKEISRGAKLCFALIRALSERKGYCWATNAYIGDRIGADSDRTVAKYISELKQAGLVEVEIIREKRGENEPGTKRIIRIPSVSAIIDIQKENTRSSANDAKHSGGYAKNVNPYYIYRNKEENLPDKKDFVGERMTNSDEDVPDDLQYEPDESTLTARDIRRMNARRAGAVPQEKIDACVEAYLKAIRDLGTDEPDRPPRARTNAVLSRFLRKHSVDDYKELLDVLFYDRNSPYWRGKMTPTLSATTSEWAVNFWKLNR